MSLLSIHNLSVQYKTDIGLTRAVDRVSLDLEEGEVLGLAGESGSGKSTLGLSILRILPSSARLEGKIEFEGKDVLSLSGEELRKFRWKSISMVPQGSMNAFDPVLTIGSQIVEAIRIHGRVGKEEAWKRTLEILCLVDIDKSRAKNYAHEFSGGMRQRAAIAMALAVNPKIVILDEPTTALDVVVQRQILNLLQKLQRELRISFIFITHDLSILNDIATRLAIMYAGQIAEIGAKSEILKNPNHPYTKALVKAIPTLRGDKSEVKPIAGFPPDLSHPPAGCRFHPRCPYVFEKCVIAEPHLVNVGNRTLTACHLYGSGNHD